MWYWVNAYHKEDEEQLIDNFDWHGPTEEIVMRTFQEENPDLVIVSVEPFDEVDF